MKKLYTVLFYTWSDEKNHTYFHVGEWLYSWIKQKGLIDAFRSMSVKNTPVNNTSTKPILHVSRYDPVYSRNRTLVCTLPVNETTMDVKEEKNKQHSNDNENVTGHYTFHKIDVHTFLNM
jgi:hypothetical protein